MKSTDGRTFVARKMLSGSVLRLANLLIAVVAALLLTPMMVHHLGDRLFGFWSLAGAFIGYYGLIDLGLSSAVSQYLCIALGKKDSVECRAVFNTSLRIQVLLGCGALAITAALAASTHWIFRNPVDATLFGKVIAVLGVSAALGFPTRVYGGVLEAQLRFDIQSGLDLFGIILRTVLIVCSISAGFGLLGLAWVTLAASVPVMALQVWFARREAAWARICASSQDTERTRGLFSYSVFSFMTSIGDLLRFQIDPLVIGGFVGIAAITHYRVASLFMRYYIAVITSSIGTFQQVSSRFHGSGDQDRLKRAFFFATKLSICISVLVGFILIAWGKPFIRRWMGEAYIDAYLPMAILTLAVFLDISQFPSISVLYATFNHRFYAYLNLAEGVINLIVSILLAPRFGILGVTIGTLAGALVTRIAIQPWWASRAAGIPYRAYMKFVVWNLLRSGFLMGCAVAVSAWGLKSSYRILSVSAIFAVVVYIAGSWLLVFNEPERKLLKKAIVNRRDSLTREAVTAASAS